MRETTSRPRFVNVFLVDTARLGHSGGIITRGRGNRKRTRRTVLGAYWDNSQPLQAIPLRTRPAFFGEESRLPAR